MDCRFDVLKTPEIRRHDSGQLLLETRQLCAVCRQTGRQGAQFAGDPRQDPLELRDDLHGVAMRTQLCVPVVIDHPTAEPAALANQAQRPDHILAVANDAGIHGEPGKLTERHDVLIHRDGKHSSPQCFPRFTPVGDDQAFTMVSQRDVELIARDAGDVRCVAPDPLDFSFKFGESRLCALFALLKKRLMLGCNGDAARFLAKVRQVAAGIEKGQLIAGLAGSSWRPPLHRAAPPCDCPCS
jgi:hypothetical protein